MNGCNETVATLIGIGVGLLAAYVFIPQVWNRILKEPYARARVWIIDFLEEL